jgi:geranylgeranyl reductase
MGLGLNCMINGEFAEMVWQFDSRKFSSGYAWIFPHRERASVGAYCLNGGLTAKTLRRRLQGWLINQGISPGSGEIRAGVVNCHFSGWNFHPVYLVGDAAGLASPLTGEGIFPAIVSAEAVAEAILGVKQPHKKLERLLVKRHKHAKLQELANLNPLFSLILSELSALLLKHRIITFERFEMA